MIQIDGRLRLHDGQASADGPRSREIRLDVPGQAISGPFGIVFASAVVMENAAAVEYPIAT